MQIVEAKKYFCANMLIVLKKVVSLRPIFKQKR